MCGQQQVLVAWRGCLHAHALSVGGSDMPCATVDQYKCEIERNIIAWRLLIRPQHVGHTKRRGVPCHFAIFHASPLHTFTRSVRIGQCDPVNANALPNTTTLVESGAHARSRPDAAPCSASVRRAIGRFQRSSAGWFNTHTRMECVGVCTCIAPRNTTMFGRHGNAGDGAHERSIAQSGATHHCWR
jgi:hypothetical protein